MSAASPDRVAGSNFASATRRRHSGELLIARPTWQGRCEACSAGDAMPLAIYLFTYPGEPWRRREREEISSQPKEGLC